MIGSQKKYCAEICAYLKYLSDECVFSVVPPSIDNHQSTIDPIVTEGSTVKLVCKTHGTPKPRVSWFRIQTNFRDDNIRTGETINIHLL